MIPIKERLESDVLIVGGGIAGLMAAIAAADKGASVILLDKANTKRSGAGATGNDHFLCYIPEKHGTINVVYEETTRRLSCVFWKPAPRSSTCGMTGAST